MQEVLDHKAYKFLEELQKKYDGKIEIDYVILKINNGNSCIDIHKKAAIKAIEILSEREKWKSVNLKIQEDKMKGLNYSPKNLLGNDKTDYANAFLFSPYSTGLMIEDFYKLNNILFSNIDNLEIYDWCGDREVWGDKYWKYNWSNYFDFGLEWWGIYFWTIYDKETDLYIVISASATD